MKYSLNLGAFDYVWSGEFNAYLRALYNRKKSFRNRNNFSVLAISSPVYEIESCSKKPKCCRFYDLSNGLLDFALRLFAVEIWSKNCP